MTSAEFYAMDFPARAKCWETLPPKSRDEIRDLSDLTPQLTGLEGWRVEVVTTYGETRRFIVSRSTGWRPCHIEVKLRTSSGGFGADKEYASVRTLRKVR